MHADNGQFVGDDDLRGVAVHPDKKFVAGEQQWALSPSPSPIWCVLIRLICIAMHWIGRSENYNVRDKYMIMKLFTRTFLVFTVNPG